MKLVDRFKLAFDAIKAAKILWTVIAALSAYSSYHGYNDVSEYMAEPRALVLAPSAMPAVEPIIIKQKDWRPIIKEEINKATKRLEYEYHGGS